MVLVCFFIQKEIVRINDWDFCSTLLSHSCIKLTGVDKTQGETNKGRSSIISLFSSGRRTWHDARRTSIGVGND